jgi:hypothetical protein
VLRKTLDVGPLRQLALDVEILLLEDECLAGRIEEDLVVGFTDNLEGERVALVFEAQIGVGARRPCIADLGPRRNVVGDNVRLFLGIGDVHTHTVGRLVPHGEGELWIVGSKCITLANELEGAVQAGMVFLGVDEPVASTGLDVASVVDGRGNVDNDFVSFGQVEPVSRDGQGGEDQEERFDQRHAVRVVWVCSRRRRS